MPDVMASIAQNMSHPRNFRKHSEEVAILWVQTTVLIVLEEIKRPQRKYISITQKEMPHAQTFPSFHDQYWSSNNNILCFDTTRYRRMTHCSMTPPCPHFLWDRLMSTQLHSQKTAPSYPTSGLNNIHFKCAQQNSMDTAPVPCCPLTLEPIQNAGK